MQQQLLAMPQIHRRILSSSSSSSNSSSSSSRDVEEQQQQGPAAASAQSWPCQRSQTRTPQLAELLQQLLVQRLPAAVKH
jgi:hypothetical protein